MLPFHHPGGLFLAERAAFCCHAADLGHAPTITTTTPQIASPCEGASKEDNAHGPSETGQDGESVASVCVLFSLPWQPLVGIGVGGGNAQPRFLVLAAPRGVSGPGLSLCCRAPRGRWNPGKERWTGWWTERPGKTAAVTPAGLPISDPADVLAAGREHGASMFNAMMKCSCMGIVRSAEGRRKWGYNLTRSTWAPLVSSPDVRI